MKILRVALLTAFALVMTGCGEPAELTSLREQQAIKTKQLADAQAASRSLEAEVARLTEEVKTQSQRAADLTDKVASLEAEGAGRQGDREASGGLFSGLFGGGKAKAPPKPRVMESYFYDVVADELFAEASDDLAPIVRANGNKAFKAYLFTCGGCGAKERFVGYYEGFTDEYKQKRLKAIEAAKAAGEAPMPDEIMYMEEGFSKGRLISTDGKTWVTSDSAEGAEINVVLSKACDDKGGRLKPCYPGMK